MRTVAISTNFRNTENWMGLFARIIEAGGYCSLISLPWYGDASVSLMKTLALPVREEIPLSSLGPTGISEEDLKDFLNRTIDEDIDVVFLCDMQSYPSNRVYGILSERPKRPVVVGLQHGLFQSWWLYNQNFCTDYLLCFGERHRNELVPGLRDRVIAVGLPKLDALKGVSIGDERYILYLAQRVPEATNVNSLLAELEAETGMPVVVRNHPQYPDLINSPGLHQIPQVNAKPVADLPYVQLLSNATWVATPHSTGGIEALYLGKPVALLPNHGLTSWAIYPGVATGLSAGAVLAAVDRARTYTGEVGLFLDDVVGGLRFDHAARAFAAVTDILERHRPPLGIFTPASSKQAISTVGGSDATSNSAACRVENGEDGFEEMAWLFACDNRNRGIIRQNFDEAALLWRSARTTGGSVLEIGRRHGGTTSLLLAAIGKRPLVSIDIAPEHHPACDEFFAKIQIRDPGRLALLVADSKIRLASDSHFGLLFVDGDSTYEGVKADVVTHWPNLRSCDGKPALVVFHDAVINDGLQHNGRINHCEGVRRFCEELVAAKCAKVREAAGSSVVMEKIGEIPQQWKVEVLGPNLRHRDEIVTLAKTGGIGIELGVAEGFLSERFLKYHILSHLYSIDMFAGDRGHDNQQYKRAIARLMPFQGNNTLIKLRFDEAIDLFPNEFFDFIYVDGYAHTGEESGKTFEDWYPKLQAGGIMAGDDYCPEWPLVVEAVDRFTTREGLPLHVIECREDIAYSRYPTWYTVKPQR